MCMYECVWGGGGGGGGGRKGELWAESVTETCCWVSLSVHEIFVRLFSFILLIS